jgi:hypothetical protein
MDKREIKGIQVNGTDCQLDLTNIVGTLTSPNGSKFFLKVDDKGNLYTDNGSTEGEDVQPLTPPTEAKLAIAKLYINEIYCGGQDADENSVNYCSHNFVELANLTDNDINLQGMSLQYTISDRDWKVLPLKGIIRSGSTFLIRGAQCSAFDSPTTKIKVTEYDMEWKLVTDGNETLIKFDDNISAKFYLTFNLDAYSSSNPYNTTTSAVTSDAIGYIDLVGIQGTGNPGGFEGSAYSRGSLSNKRLYRKYYAMDPVKQATKAINARNNANDWCYIDLTKENGEVIPNIEVYTPRASYEKKNLFYNKTGLQQDKPTVITCSFGIQATDSGSGATRCFNWVSSNTGDKYLWIRTKGSQTWGEAMESFNDGDGRSFHSQDFYNRKVKKYSGGFYLIINKFIKSGLTVGTYEYIAGSKNSDGTPNIGKCTNVRTFTVRSTQDVIENGFTFVQTSDQQGFNWEEYEVWAATARLIGREDTENKIEFMINTGDMTQNGNRLGEWIDYFNAKGNFLENMEEMATIGNNDLSLNPLSLIGKGEDYEKLWHENIDLFYTFEADDNNLPVFEVEGNNYFVPSLYSFNYGNVHFICLNSEIKDVTETSELSYGFSTWGNFYPYIKAWCEADIQNNSGYNWNIMLCHEMPFTIQIATVVKDRMDGEHGSDWSMVSPNRIKNGGGCSACANISDDKRYWVSEFCQTNNIRLVIGGHKHTQATTFPILENIIYNESGRTVDSYHPIIPVNAGTLSSIWDATELVPYNGYKYPDSWFVNGLPKDDATKRMIGFCTFIMEDELPVGTKPVVYAMSQATGYKHTSNKELPSPDIAWLQYYFPATVTWSNNDSVKSPTKNNGQMFPFYTVWNIGANKIEGSVRKAYGIFNNKGKFDINIEGAYARKDMNCLSGEQGQPITSINGITAMSDTDAKTDNRIIEIVK